VNFLEQINPCQTGFWFFCC